MANQFKVTFSRDRRRPFRVKELTFLVDDEDGGFVVDVVHLIDGKAVKLSGFIGTKETSTTVDFEGSPRIKRVTGKRK